jgi:hypothetical protein
LTRLPVLNAVADERRKTADHVLWRASAKRVSEIFSEGDEVSYQANLIAFNISGQRLLSLWFWLLIWVLADV